MQALQELTRSLNDPASLQKLRANLLDIPRLLQQTSQPDDCFLGDVSGDHNFRFTFRLEGGGFFQTGVLIAAAESVPSGLPVPLKCRWKRRVGDLPVEIPGVTSNMYQVSADDVGAEIWVEAHPADVEDGHRGTAFGSIGPFELDPSTRRSLDNALAHSSGKFTAMITTPAGNRQDIIIHANDEGVRVSLGGRDRPGKEVWTEYSAEFPRIIVHPLDTTKFQLIMNETRIFNLIAHSRTARDLVALTIRCMHARKFLPPSTILNRLLPVQPLVPGTPPAMPGLQDRRLRSCIVLDRLAKELNRAMQRRELAEKGVRNTSIEKKDLQEQLMETITGFTEVIEGLHQQAVEGGCPSLCTTSQLPAEGVQEQLREVVMQSRGAQAELQDMQQRLEKLQAARAAREAERRETRGRDHRELAGQLREERDMLRSRLSGLGAPGGQQQQRGQGDDAQELKRVRQDAEALFHEKEALRQRLQERERERVELQESFLYVKGQLDIVQVRQAQGGAGGAEKELNRSRQSLETATLERNQLSNRLEDTLRDQEKEKAYHEQSLERYSSANSRLMEERDRAEREVRRLAQLYSQCVGQLPGDLDTTAAGALPEGLHKPAGPLVDPEELLVLRRKLAQADEAVQRKDQENASLKHRIRKLAAA